MTPHEFGLTVRGSQGRIEERQQIAAWVTANIMNCWVKKGTTITPDRLLGRSKGTRVTIEQARKRGAEITDKSDRADEKERVKGRRQWGRA